MTPLLYLHAARKAAKNRQVRWAAAGITALCVLTAGCVAMPLLMFATMPGPPPAVVEKTAPKMAVPGQTVAGIPPVSYAALVLASQGSAAGNGGCYVRWQLVGGVMGIESGYGTFKGSQPDPVTGLVTPPIFGEVPLDGRPGIEAIKNDDYGRSLGVVGEWARAVGPTQFIPSTWRALGRDGDGDGVADPQNIYDAAASTVAYLCAHGYLEGDLARTSTAIFRYNPSAAYVQAVLARAADLDAATAVAVGAPSPSPGLSTVGGITVASSLAGQLQALLDAAAVDGIRFGGYGYRSYEDQVTLRRKNCPAGYDLYQGDSGGCSPPTARPGYSMHEQGEAIDFYADGATLTRGSRGFRWLETHGSAYGLINLPSEPWHWSTTGA